MEDEKSMVINWESVLIEMDIMFGKFKREISNVIKPFYDAAVQAQQQVEQIKKELEDIKKSLEDK